MILSHASWHWHFLLQLWILETQMFPMLWFCGMLIRLSFCCWQPKTVNKSTIWVIQVFLDTKLYFSHCMVKRSIRASPITCTLPPSSAKTVRWAHGLNTQAIGLSHGLLVTMQGHQGWSTSHTYLLGPAWNREGIYSLVWEAPSCTLLRSTRPTQQLAG